MDFLSYINCCVVLSGINGQKTTGMGKKTHRNSMWISYGTLIAVWYCPVVMGKKPHRNGQKTPQEWAKTPLVRAIGVKIAHRVIKAYKLVHVSMRTCLTFSGVEPSTL